MSDGLVPVRCPLLPYIRERDTSGNIVDRSHERAFTVNLTAGQLYFRLARIKDCAAIRGPPPQPDILDDVLGLRRASENAVLESGPLSDTTSVVWAFTRLGVSRNYWMS